MPQLAVYVTLSLLLVLSRPAIASESTHSLASAQTDKAEGMLTMRIMVAKFRDLVLSIHDINKLESIGMPHADADLMRLTLQEKIRQAQNQTLDSIWRLKKS